eukprot:3298078-Prymnesium_polylepis.1
MVVFGVLGLQLFKGSLLHRCYMPGGAEPIDPQRGVCAPGDGVAGGGNWSGGVGNVAAEADASFARGSCAAGQECRFYGRNPLYGTVSFDSIFGAWMVIFQCITLEGWAEILYLVQVQAGAVAGPFFISVISIGSFYVLNLFLAVMWHTYESQPSDKPPRSRATSGSATPDDVPPPPPVTAANSCAAPRGSDVVGGGTLCNHVVDLTAVTPSAQRAASSH